MAQLSENWAHLCKEHTEILPGKGYVAAGKWPWEGWTEALDSLLTQLVPSLAGAEQCLLFCMGGWGTECPFLRG